MKTLILVNVLRNIDSVVYSNHIAFWSFTKAMYPKSEGHEFILFTPPRMSIDMARNSAAKEAMRHECDYLMFIDDDILIPPNTFKSLLDAQADISAGLVIIRGYPFHVMAFKHAEGHLTYFDELPKVEVIYNENEKIEAIKDPVTREDGLAAVGFSCCLIKVSILKKIPPPFFVSGPYNTEDIYFCDKVREFVPDVNISLVTHIQPGHMLFSEPIEYVTIDLFKEFYETLQPELKNFEKIENSRTTEYIKANLKKLE